METGNNSTVRSVDLRDSMGNVSRKLEKILAVVDQMNENYFETVDSPSINALLSVIYKPNGIPITGDERLSYDWIVDYSRIQSFIEIIEDYIRESKNMMDVMREEVRTGQAKGAA